MLRPVNANRGKVMIRQEVVAAVYRVARERGELSDDDYVIALSATREELVVAFPDASPEWYDRTVEKNHERFFRFTFGKTVH